MTPQEFEQVLEARLTATRTSLASKAQEYATDEDRLHNFKRTAAFTGGTPEQAAWGFVMKHLTALNDMIQSGQPHPLRIWNERVGDTVNYLILIEALVKEKECTATTTSLSPSSSESLDSSLGSSWPVMESSPFDGPSPFPLAK